MVYVLMWLEAVYRLYMQQKDSVDNKNNNTTYRLMNYSTTTKGHSQASNHNSVSNCRWPMCEWALTVVTRKDPCLGKETYEVRRPIIGVFVAWWNETMKNKQNPLDMEKSLGFLNSQLPTSSIWERSIPQSGYLRHEKNRYAMHFLSFNLDPPVSQVLACSSFRRHVRDVQFFVQCWPRGSSGRTTPAHWSGQN